MEYAVRIVPEGDAFVVSSRDLPELNSVGYSLDEAKQEALDGIETALMIYYMDGKKTIPLPSEAQEGEFIVRLPAQVAVKVALYNEMLKQKITRAELGRRLHWQQAQVNRLWSLDHSTKLENIEAAFHALGREIELVVA
ncbi:type II toxin-antitoxin system HicB family antitoxin [Acinetobacter sp. NIPH 1852]|uniref:type II toxin-antitoxin system HicB family antitoxin n=1 Tax=Acinetobacter sp. NIPH 1852 TaxID=2923428 RepID=UPI001F4BC23E|nr:type II toxin-antitoxin system HicB family antitoxin [Acinetobacter sp. NIPH 1852]MCH7306594.1 type II toxin-antitoxin system HicB family antitoxin [Acinetobacter sp. NIPH 1852]